MHGWDLRSLACMVAGDSSDKKIKPNRSGRCPPHSVWFSSWRSPSAAQQGVLGLSSGRPHQPRCSRVTACPTCLTGDGLCTTVFRQLCSLRVLPHPTQRPPPLPSSPSNIILELAPGGTAEYDKKLLIDDVVVGIDGVRLVDAQGNMLTKLKDKMATLPQRDVHHFLVQRRGERRPAGGQSTANGSPSWKTLPAPAMDYDDDMATVIVPQKERTRSSVAERAEEDDVDARAAAHAAAAAAYAHADMIAAHTAAKRGADSSIGVICLAPDGARFKQFVQLTMIEDAGALMEVATEAWEASCQRIAPGPLRMEGVLHSGDRLMLNRSTPSTALRGISELRVSSPHLVSADSAAAPVRSSAPKPDASNKQLMLMGSPSDIHKEYVASAVDVAVKRSAVEAVATTSVLHDLLSDLSRSQEVESAETSEALSHAVVTAAEGDATPPRYPADDGEESLASTLPPDSNGGGDDSLTLLLPPPLLAKLRPRLATALQRSAALAMKATEEAGDIRLRTCINEMKEAHAQEMEKALTAARATSERERTTAVDKAIKALLDQSQDRQLKESEQLRMDLAARAEKERVAAVQSAVVTAMRQAESSKKQAIDFALAAAEKQHHAVQERAIQAAEERIAQMWRGGVKSTEGKYEEKLAAANLRIEAIQQQAEATAARNEARLKEARDEADNLRDELEKSELRLAKAERQGQIKAKEEYVQESKGRERQQEKHVRETLKAYERRAEEDKQEAVKKAEEAVVKRFTQDRLEIVERMEQSKKDLEEAKAIAHRRGMEAGRDAARKEMADAEVKATVQARAEATVRMQERAQADVAKALAAAKQRAASFSTAVSSTAQLAVSSAIAGSSPVPSFGGVQTSMTTVSALPGVAEAIAAAEAAAKQKTIDASEAVVSSCCDICTTHASYMAA